MESSDGEIDAQCGNKNTLTYLIKSQELEFSELNRNRPRVPFEVIFYLDKNIFSIKILNLEHIIFIEIQKVDT